MLKQEVLRRSSASLFSLQSASRRWLLALAGLLWALGGALGWAQAPDDLVWRQTKGPVGGKITALAVDSTTGYLFAGAYGGVFRSTDQGASWQKAGLNGAQIRDLFVYGNTLYVSVWGDGLYRSTDYGATWHPMGAEFPSRSIHLMADAHDRLWASFTEWDAEAGRERKKVYRSTDGGQTWEQIAFPVHVFMKSILVYPGTGHLLAGTSGGDVYRSNDDGATWRLASTGLPSARGALSLAIDRRTGHVYVGFINEKLYRSKDGGQTWETTGFPHDCVVALAIDAVGYIYVGTPGHGPFRSTDGGVTWEEANTGLPAIPYDEPYYLSVDALVVTPEGHLLAGTNGGGVYRSVDRAQAWTSLNTGLVATRVTALTVTQQGRVIVNVVSGQLFTSTDGGHTWTLSRLPVSFIKAFVVEADGHVLAAASGETPFFRSMDGGETWMPLKPTGLGPSRRPLALTLSAEGYLYLGTEYGVYRSTDRGETWTALLTNGGDRLRIRALVITPEGDLFAGSDDEVYRSTDDGATWTPTGLNDRIGPMAVTAEGHLIAASTYRIHRSTDRGASWQTVYQWENESRVHVNVLLVGADGDLFAGTNSDGVLRSTDDGETWQPANVGLSGGGVEALAVHPGTGQLFAGTGTGGVFRGDASTPVDVGRFTDAVPADVHLLQNYPNPFRAATTIEFALSEATRVRLAVYDGLGREVAVMVDALMRPGVYRLPFAADSLPSGLYVYRLETQARTVTQTMVHVR